MAINRKSKNITYNRKRNRVAIACVLEYLSKAENCHAQESYDKLGPDILIYEDSFRPSSHLLLRVQRNWEVDDFPFPTVRIFASEIDIMHNCSLPGALWILRKDLNRAISIPDTSLDLRDLYPVEIDTRNWGQIDIAYFMENKGD